MARQEIGGLRFEWDEAKNRLNQAKHGVGFRDAATAFLDPNALISPDYRSEGEPRFVLVGISNALLLFFVAYTERERDGKETIRIISARKGDKDDWRRYIAAR